MTHFFLMLLLIPLAMGTTDVCCRFYQLSEGIDFVDIQSVDTGAPPICDHRDMCTGFLVDGASISCKEAFVFLSQHTQRPPLVIPPILMPRSRFKRQLATDFVDSLNDTDLSRDSHYLAQVSLDTQDLLLEMAHVVEEITERTRLMFPRIFYNDEIDGPLFRQLRNITDCLTAFIAQSSQPVKLVVITHISRSHWMREWSFHIIALVRYIAEQTLSDMELAIIPSAATIHAYLYLYSTIGIDHPFSIDLFWLLSVLSKYDPLYVQGPASELVWTIPHLPGHRIPVDIHIGPDIDWGHFQDIVWGCGPQHNATDLDTKLRNPRGLAKNFIRSIVILVRAQHGQSAEDLMVRKRYNIAVQAVHRLAYTMRFFQRETEFDLGSLEPEIVQAMGASSSALRMDHFTMTTLLRVTRIRVNPELLWRFIAPFTIPMRACDAVRPSNVSYTAPGHLNVLEFINGILSYDKYSLSQEWPFGWNVIGSTNVSKTDLHRDALVSFFASPILFSINTNLDGDLVHTLSLNLRFHKEIHMAFGRLIGVCLRTPYLRKLLIPYWTRSQPTTILESIFFGSNYVRKGVYDVLPYGVLEEMFPNATAMVDSLVRLPNATEPL